MKNKDGGWRSQPACQWLQDKFNQFSPIEVEQEVINVLKNETAAIGLFKAIAGLSLIAAGKNDKKGHNACCDALVVLSNVFHNIKAISEDFTKARKDYEQEN